MPKNITVYSRATCGPCRQLKSFLKIKGFSFEEKDVDNPDNASEAYAFSGLSIVPVTVVTNQDDTQEVVSGCNLSQLIPLIA